MMSGLGGPGAGEGGEGEGGDGEGGGGAGASGPPLTAAQHYLYRMTLLGAAAALAAHVPRDVLGGELLSAVAGRADDAVPNVRFCVAKALERVAPLLAREAPLALERSVKPCLARLCEDGDADVRFFAGRAMAACDAAVAAATR